MLKTVGNPASRTGDQTIVNGNLVIGTAGKGIDFSADGQAAGMSSELLDDYEEGTWTPVDDSGAGLTLTINNARYTKIGNRVFISAYITYPTTADASPIFISGLPFTSASNFRQMYVGSNSTASVNGMQISGASTTGAITTVLGALATNVELSTKFLMIDGHYEV